MVTHNPQSTTEYHPPLTGLESLMEEEIAREARREDPAVEKAREFRQESSKTSKSSESKADRKVEEAMHLDM